MSNPEEPAVVFVPGLGLDDREWTGVSERLAGAAGTVLLPAQGLPASRETDLSVQAQAGRLLDWLDMHLGAGPVVVVGHSEGCPIAVEAAARSSRVGGLVLVGPVTDPAARSWPRTVQRWGRTACHERLAELPVLLPQYARTGLRSLLRGHDAMRRYPTGEGLARVSVPVVVVRGELDRIPSPEWVAGLVAAPGRSILVVARAGHMVPLTHPEAVAMAVHQVRARVRPPSSEPVGA